MAKDQVPQTHAAEGAALGFYYQSFFALFTLLSQDTDNAAIGIEQLDDVELNLNGQKLLYQLKHSIREIPPSITLKSKSIWRTVKVWVDILPKITLSETTLHLVVVGKILQHSPLNSLSSLDLDRGELVASMKNEAQRVVDARSAAKKSKQPAPYADRADGCEAFLSLSVASRTIVWPLVEQIWVLVVPVLHRLHGRLALEG